MKDDKADALLDALTKILAKLDETQQTLQFIAEHLADLPSDLANVIKKSR